MGGQSRGQVRRDRLARLAGVAAEERVEDRGDAPQRVSGRLEGGQGVLVVRRTRVRGDRGEPLLLLRHRRLEGGTEVLVRDPIERFGLVRVRRPIEKWVSRP